MKMDKRTRLFFLFGNYYAFIVTGLVVLMTGAILPYLMKEFKLSYDQGGFLLSLQAVGNLSAGIISGVTSDIFGRKITLVFGAVFFTIGFGGIMLCSTSSLLFVVIFISGLGWGILNNLVNSVVSDVTEGNSSIINLLHTFFAIGAFAAPFLVGLFIRLNMGWRFPVGIVVVMSAILVAVFSVMPIHSNNKASSRNKVSFEFLKHIRFFIFMGILFFYVGTEGSINGWLVTYLIDTNIMNEALAQNILSAMWIVMIVGRLICAYISTKISNEKILLGSSLGIITFLILFLVSGNPVFITICIAAVGMSLAGMYPTTVANASYLIKGSGMAAGLMLSCGGLGASVVPLIVGFWAQSKGIHAGMFVIVLSAAVLATLTLSNFISSKRAKM
jgi:MFS transporter, FHS family, glucose/mannose:H+ symporter